MKLRFNRAEMAEALRAVCGVAATRTPKPVLRCVRIDAKSDVVLLSATDLEVGLRFAVTQVEVDKQSSTLVVADTLLRIVSECADEVLACETAGQQLSIRGTGSHFKIVTQDAAEFPPIPAMEGAPDFTIAHDRLRGLMEWTIFSSARESSRYAINGVYWEVNGEQLTLAATDGRRLSVGHSPIVPGAVAAPPSVIVPIKTMQLLAKLPGESDAPVGVKISPNQIMLNLGGILVSSVLVEGHFPRYQDVIPADCNRIMEVDTTELLSALKRAALLTNDESKGVRLALSEGNLTMSSRAPEQGEATVSLPVRYNDEAMEIGFNPVFLLDVLKVTQSERIKMGFKDANRPGVVRVGEEFTYVVMPVNLASA